MVSALAGDKHDFKISNITPFLSYLTTLLRLVGYRP